MWLLDCMTTRHLHLKHGDDETLIKFEAAIAFFPLTWPTQLNGLVFFLSAETTAAKLERCMLSLYKQR